MLRRMIAVMIVLSALFLAYAETAPEWLSGIADLIDAKQIVAVAATSGSTKAEFYMATKSDDGSWVIDVKAYCAIGRGGLGKAYEGDKKTPTGLYRFTMAFGNGEDPGCKMGYYKVNGNDYWSGDRREGYGYNTMVSLIDLPDLNKSASDRIADYTVSYKYCLNISYNEECVPGLGAAIFLHCRKPGNTSTAGCVALNENDMLNVMTCVIPGCSVVIDYKSKLTTGYWQEFYADNGRACRLPSGTESIGTAAFFCCEELKIIEIPESVTYIADDAFEGTWNPIVIVKENSYADTRCRQLGLNVIAVS